MSGLWEFPDGTDTLLAPVAAGFFRYESLLDGTLDLADVVRCVAFMNMRAHNERQILKASERK